MAKRVKDKFPIIGRRARAAIYARFSSHNQRGESIEIQLDNDYAYCDAHDLDVYDVYVDEAKTGRNSDREDFQRMLADAQQHLFDYVVIYKVPRIMRNRDEMAMARIMLRKCGVEILYAGEQIAEGSTGILQLGMLELLAEWESAVDSERILDGIEKNAERGMANGQPYYGWDITPDGYYSINGPEARILRTMKDMLLSGSMVAEIVRALAPYRTRKGKPFSHNAVTKLLRRRQNGGEYSYFGHVIPGGMPALWSMEEQEMILRILDKRSKPRKRSEEGEYALTGKLYHGGCDVPMVGTSGTSKSGATYYYYRCRKCRKTVRRDTVEESVVEAVVNALSNPATREKIADLMTEFEQGKNVKPQSEVIKDELHSIELAYNRIWKAIEAGMAPPGGKERIDELTNRQKMLEDELRVAKSIEAASLERDRVLFWLENMAEQLDGKTIIEVFVARVVLVDDDLHIMFTFDDNADITNPLLDDGGGVFDQMSPCSTISFLHEPPLQDGGSLFLAPRAAGLRSCCRAVCSRQLTRSMFHVKHSWCERGKRLLRCAGSLRFPRAFCERGGGAMPRRWPRGRIPAWTQSRNCTWGAMNRTEALRILGLDDDATPEDVKTAYKETVQILHPDRFASNKKLQDRATEQFKNLQEAYDYLTSGKGSRTSARDPRAAAARARSYTSSNQVEARMAGIAAARVQLVKQRDVVYDERRNGIALAVIGGAVALLTGRRPFGLFGIVAAISSAAAVWGIVQIVSAQRTIATLSEHIAELNAEERRLAEQLEEE